MAFEGGKGPENISLMGKIRSMSYAKENGNRFNFEEGLAKVSKNGHVGFVDTAFKEVIPLRYVDANNFSEGLAAVAVGTEEGDKRWGFIDKGNNQVVEPVYKEVKSFSEGLAAVAVDTGNYGQSWNFINKDGEAVLSNVSQSRVTSFKDGSAWIGVGKGNVSVYEDSPFGPRKMSGVTEAHRIDTKGNVLEKKTITSHSEEVDIFGYDNRYEPADI